MLKKYLFSFLLLFTALHIKAQDYPAKSTTLVTDYTNTLSADEKAQLEHKLVAYADSTSTQLAIVLMKTVNGTDIAEYGKGLGNAWGIGQKDKNNGVLILAALDDHKVTIQTGTGATSALPDVMANQIINNDIIPAFKQRNFYAGLDAATSSVIQYMSGQYQADAQPQTQQHYDQQQVQDNSDDHDGSMFVIVIIIVVVLVLIFRNTGGRGGGQIISGRGGASPFWWFLAGSALGSNWGNGWGNNGGNDGGGFSGGDSGGGGDFGGFDGGDFGGGGSSGSW